MNDGDVAQDPHVDVVRGEIGNVDRSGRALEEMFAIDQRAVGQRAEEVGCQQPLEPLHVRSLHGSYVGLVELAQRRKVGLVGVMRQTVRDRLPAGQPFSDGIMRWMLRPYRGTAPRVHPTAFIDESAQIIGDVEIGEESSVWMCAVVRGDVNVIRVGRRTNVQDGAVVHAMTGTHETTIGDNVTIGHAAVIHGCTIEHQCLIGIGAILLNGARIGSGSIVAAGTLITENMRVPPKSLVMGSPGKVKRLLTQAEIADIQLYADRYVGYRLEYMP